jgi:hypothetical protein
LTHQISSNLGISDDLPHHFNHLLQAGQVLHVFSYERQKHSVFSKVLHWLALVSLSHFFVWMSSSTGSQSLAAQVYSQIKICPSLDTSSSECTCGPSLPLLIALSHHIAWYLAGLKSEEENQIPVVLTQRLVSNLNLPPSQILWCDIQSGSHSAVSSQRADRHAEEFVRVFALVLEQIFVYPHVHGLFAMVGVELAAKEETGAPIQYLQDI